MSAFFVKKCNFLLDKDYWGGVAFAYVFDLTPYYVIMKRKLILPLITTLFFSSLGFAENPTKSVVIDITKSGTLLLTPTASTNYDIEIKEGVTFTNTALRIVNDVAGDGCTYNIFGDGNLVVTGTNSAHAVVFGNGSNKTPNSNIILDVNTTVNKSTGNGSNVTLTNAINVSFYKNLTATGLNLADNGGSANGTVTFGKAGSTTAYTATFGNLNGKTLALTVNKNYTVNFTGSVTAKSITLNGGTMTAESIAAANAPSVNVSSGTLNTSKDMYFSGTSYLSGGTIKSSQRITLGTGTTLVHTGGTLSASYGLQFTGATYEYHGGSSVQQIVTSGGTVKLYNDISMSLMKVNGANTLDIYWNGFETTLTGNANGNQGLYTDGNVDAKFNLIVEKGYNWNNDKFFVGNITDVELIDRIGAVQIGDTRYEAGEWSEILEFVETTITIGETQRDGFYINVVPEPAEWAMVFGLLALGFVAYRRRK